MKRISYNFNNKEYLRGLIMLPLMSTVNTIYKSNLDYEYVVIGSSALLI